MCWPLHLWMRTRSHCNFSGEWSDSYYCLSTKLAVTKSYWVCVFYIEFVKSATTVVEIVDGKNSYLVLVLTAVLQLCWGIKSEKLLLWSDTKTYGDSQNRLPGNLRVLSVSLWADLLCWLFSPIQGLSHIYITKVVLTPKIGLKGKHSTLLKDLNGILKDLQPPTFSGPNPPFVPISGAFSVVAECSLALTLERPHAVQDWVLFCSHFF